MYTKVYRLFFKHWYYNLDFKRQIEFKYVYFYFKTLIHTLLNNKEIILYNIAANSRSSWKCFHQN